MSSLTVTTIRSANGSTDLTVGSGNTLGAAIIVGANGSGITFQTSPSNTQTFIVNTTSVYLNGSSILGNAIRQQVGTGTGACTTFTVTGGYNAGGLDVYVNGVKQFGSSVNVSSGTNVVFNTAPASGAIIEVVGFLTSGLGGTVTTNTQYTWSNTQTFNSNVVFNANVSINNSLLSVTANNSSSITIGNSTVNTVINSTAHFIGNATSNVTLISTGFSGNASVLVPVGNTAQRPTTTAGALRYNSDSSSFEGYNGSAWGSLGGATGAGTDQAFFLNGLTVNTSFTIPTGKSAHTVGPLTLASGVTITVPAGSKYVVL